MTTSPASAIRAILFDKDGTLLDFSATWVPLNHQVALAAAKGDPELARRLLASGGHDPDSDFVAPGSLLAAGDAGEVAAHWLPLLPHHDLESLTNLVNSVFDRSAEVAVPLPATADVVSELHGKGYRLGLATSDSEAAARGFLSRWRLDNHFCFVAGWDSGHGRKPEPGMLRAFARACDLPPETIAVIGDSPQDMRMGLEGGAGLLIGVLTGTASAGDLAPPAHGVLASLAELPPYLAERA